MQDYPRSQWERIMKIQDVFLKATYRSITWKDAADILRVDQRTIRRWKQTIDDSGGYGGSFRSKNLQA